MYLQKMKLTFIGYSFPIVFLLPRLLHLSDENATKMLVNDGNTRNRLVLSSKSKEVLARYFMTRGVGRRGKEIFLKRRDTLAI